MSDMFSPEMFTAFCQVVFIDLTLAGDNAVVIGLAATGLPAAQRGRAIVIGIIAATVMRIALAGFATQVLQIVGLLLAGGILLLWVSWKMWRELRQPAYASAGAPVLAGGNVTRACAPKSLSQAVTQIMLADLSMSLDNVLAVAGAARDHPMVLIFGLTLSILLMGMAATFLARLLQEYKWICYIGLFIVLFVAADMIVRGGQEIWVSQLV